MGPALPIIGTGLALYSTIKGAQQQGQARRMTEEQLAQQDQIRKLVLGRLMGGGHPMGAVGNPFSGSYGPIAGAR